MFGISRRGQPSRDVRRAFNYRPLAGEDFRWSQIGGGDVFMLTSHRLFAIQRGGPAQEWSVRDINTARLVRQGRPGSRRDLVELTFHTTPGTALIGPVDRYDWVFNHISEVTARPIRLELV